MQFNHLLLAPFKRRLEEARKLEEEIKKRDEEQQMQAEDTDRKKQVRMAMKLGSSSHLPQHFQCRPAHSIVHVVR